MATSGDAARAQPARGRFRQPDEYGLALVLIMATIVTIAVVGSRPIGQLLAATLSGGPLLFILRTAAHDLGQMVAVTEALFGQLYLVSAVALLIGNIGRSRSTGPAAAAPDMLDELGALAKDPPSDPTPT